MPGEAGGFDYIQLISGLLGLGGNDIQTLTNAVNDVANNLATTELFGFNYMGLLSGFMGELVNSLRHVLRAIVDAVFKGGIIKALGHLWDLFKKLQAWVTKLKRWLDRFHAIQRSAQMQAFRRVINIIQRIRKVLVIFKLFHLKFATKLDNWLAGIEGKLIQRQAQFRAKTNEIIGWLNVIADPLQAYRKGLLFGSYGRLLRGFGAALAGIGLAKVFPFIAQITGPGITSRPWRDVTAQFHSEVDTNSGDYGAVQSQMLAFNDMFDEGFGTKS